MITIDEVNGCVVLAGKRRWFVSSNRQNAVKGEERQDRPNSRGRTLLMLTSAMKVLLKKEARKKS